MLRQDSEDGSDVFVPEAVPPMGRPGSRPPADVREHVPHLHGVRLLRHRHGRQQEVGGSNPGVGVRGRGFGGSGLQRHECH